MSEKLGGWHLREIYRRTFVWHLYVETCPDDIYGKPSEGSCGKLSVGWEEVCETLFAGRLWDSICKASVKTNHTDKCQNNVSGHLWRKKYQNISENLGGWHLWEIYRRTSVWHLNVAIWPDDIYGKLSGGHVWETICRSEGSLRDTICRTSVGLVLQGICENQSNGQMSN